MEQGLEILGATAIEDKLQVVSPLTKFQIITGPPRYPTPGPHPQLV
jgi:hypothetical protein